MCIDFSDKWHGACVVNNIMDFVESCKGGVSNSNFGISSGLVAPAVLTVTQ